MREYIKRRFSFQGRIGRRQYWIATLLYSLAWGLGAVILVVLAALNYNPPDDRVTGLTIAGFVVLGIAAVALAVATVTGLASSGVRRLHDRGKTGYWLLLYYLLPSMMSKNAGLDDNGLVVGLIIAGIILWATVDLGIIRGEAGGNAFGPDPLAKDPAPPPLP
jgi:uncharacterized membrane protein YhaH (DUF805 family)